MDHKGKYSHTAEAVDVVEEPRQPHLQENDAYDERVEYPERVERVETPVQARRMNGVENEQISPLVLDEDLNRFQSRWKEVQIEFVDNPRQAVEAADILVEDVMDHVARVFAKERSRLGDEWREVDNVSTEDLRLILQYYRSFFNRLLSV